MKRAIPHEVPSSGNYETVDRLTKIRVSSTTFEGLLKRIYHVRGAIGAVSGADLRTELESWICEEQPGECGDVDMNVPRKRHLNLSDVIRGTKVMMAFKLAGSPLVPREEAERRGAICKTCPYNQKFDKPCVGWCPELASLVNSIVGHQGTYYDQFLHACQICGCFLPAAIWLPDNLQMVGMDDTMRNQFKAIPHCWKGKTESTE